MQCYSCEGRDNDPCVLNPAALNGKVVTCSQNQYCSIIRRELPPRSTGINLIIICGMIIILNTKSPFTILRVVVISNNGTISVNTGSNSSTTSLSPEMTNATAVTILDVVSIPESNNETTSNGTSSWSSTLGNLWDTLTEGIRNTTEKNISSSSMDDPVNEVITPAQLLISRGCKSKDFLQGWMLQSSNNNGNSGNASSSKVFTQLCSTNLCNFGDGRKSLSNMNSFTIDLIIFYLSYK